MLAMFGTALPTLIVFPQERPVFIREYSTNHYSVLSYFTSRLALEAFLTAVQVIIMVREVVRIEVFGCKVFPGSQQLLSHFDRPC